MIPKNPLRLMARVCLVLLFGSALLQPVSAWCKKDKDKGKDSASKGGPAKVNATTFGISPSIFTLDCRPGEKKTLSIKVENPNRNAISVTLYPLAMVPVGAPDLLAKSVSSQPPNDLSRHVIVESPSITLGPNSYKNISATLDVPAGLTGTQYVGITAASTTGNDLLAPGADMGREDEVKHRVGVGMQPAIGITVKCDIEGTLKPAYSLLKLKAVPATGNQPLSVKASVKNTGNAELEFLPIIILMDASNKVVARLKSENLIRLIPAATREISMAPSFSNVPKGSYKAVLTMNGTRHELPASQQSIVIQ